MLRIRLARLLSSRNHFTPYDIWVQNLTAYFHKIYNNSNGLSKVTVTITVLIIVYLTFNFHFFISSDLDKTFKCCILHYLNKLLMVFMKFKENQNNRSVRWDFEISKIHEPDLASRTYDRSNLQGSKDDSEC